jgi:hypothetical protein
MYLRSTTRANRDGSEVTYYQLAQSVWDAKKGRSDAKIVYNFGRADEVNVEELRRLSESIRRVCDARGRADDRRVVAAGSGALPEDVDLLPAKNYGGFFLVEALWKRVELDKILASNLPRRGKQAPHVTAILAMVANRLLAPSSKLACYEAWLRDGVYFPAGAELKLSQLYAAMDFLSAHSEEVENALFFRVADLFSLDVDLIFFDTTSVYFEVEAEEDEHEPGEEGEDESQEDRAEATGEEEHEPLIEAGRRKRGKNKEGRDGNPQVVVALAVTRDGLPVRSWVFPGNTADVTTIKKVREDLKGWKLSRVLFVGDAGFYSADNLKTLSSGGGRYLLATPLRKVKELHAEVLKRAGRYRELNEKLGVKEVVVGDGEARRRYFVCRNQREAERAQRHRKRLLELLRAKLAELEPQREGDHLKKACRLLTSKRFARFLTKDEKGRIFLDPKKVKADERFDGKWVVTTNDDTLSPEDGALGYKAALIIEACFRRLKTTGLKIRPVYHWRSRRIIAHVKLCVFALLLQRIAEIACGDTWRNIRLALRSIQVVPCETPSGSFFHTTHAAPDALALLGKLKVPPPPRLLAVVPKTSLVPEGDA